MNGVNFFFIYLKKNKKRYNNYNVKNMRNYIVL